MWPKLCMVQKVLEKDYPGYGPQERVNCRYSVRTVLYERVFNYIPKKLPINYVTF